MVYDTAMACGYKGVIVMKVIILMTRKTGKVNLHGVVVIATLDHTSTI
jgi:hypothetical protein